MERFSQYYSNKVEQQTPQFLIANQQGDIILQRNNIRLQFYLSTETAGRYKLSYIVHIISPNNIQLRASQINDASLKQAILDNVDDRDKEYLSLENYSTNKAEFFFDHNKWINDAFKGHTIHKEFSIFNRKIKLRIELPKLIMINAMRIYFEKFIEKKIKNYIKEKRLEKTKFIPFLPKEFSKSLNTTASNLFNYTYDIQSNFVFIRLKPELILAASLLLATAIKTDTNYSVDYKKPDFFNTVVKRHLNITNKEWELKVNKGKR